MSKDKFKEQYDALIEQHMPAQVGKKLAERLELVDQLESELEEADKELEKLQDAIEKRDKIIQKYKDREDELKDRENTISEKETELKTALSETRKEKLGLEKSLVEADLTHMTERKNEIKEVLLKLAGNTIVKERVLGNRPAKDNLGNSYPESYNEDKETTQE